MLKAYDEIVDFIAMASPAAVLGFKPSQTTKDRVANLINREKTESLSIDESAELDRYLQLEQIMRLAKARARRHVPE